MTYRTPEEVEEELGAIDFSEVVHGKGRVKYPLSPYHEQKIKSYIHSLRTQDRHSLLQMVRDWGEKQRTPNISEMESGSEFMTPRMYRALGRESVLDDLLAFIDGELKK